MSTRYKPPKCSLRQQKLKWMNSLVHTHDIFCDCPHPLEHTAYMIFEQEPELKFTTPEQDTIKKCLTSTTGMDIVADDHDNDGFGEGDLEDLFKEDFGEENTEG